MNAPMTAAKPTVLSSLADRLAKGETLLSAWYGLPDPSIAAILAQEGFDAVTLDMQHGPMTLADVLGKPMGSMFGGRYFIGPTISNPAAKAYFDAHGGEFEEDEEGTLSATLAADYRITEKITAGYIMSRLRFGDLTVIPGVRVERKVCSR